MMSPDQVRLLRRLPSVDKLVESQPVAAMLETWDRPLVIEAARAVLNQKRAAIRQNGSEHAVDHASLVDAMGDWLANLVAPTLVPVINATGVIVHTNLGRAPLSQNALAAIQAIGSGYSNLEYDLEPGKRGSRSTHAAGLLQRITGAEAATVVNNAASAVLLMLSALCAGCEVIVSRGQLVEIGGGFRMPDVMRQAGVKLVEVGTTNRTHLRDFAEAINENTSALLQIHHSNYKIVGFTTEPGLDDLAELAHANGLPLLFDQGSGAMIDTAQFGLEREPLVQESIAAGCDVVAFSGDKLLGGPQAGVLIGRDDLIATIKRHPLARAVRPDKLAYAGLGATLASFVTGKATQEVPVWSMMAQTVDEVGVVAARWCERLAESRVHCAVVDARSTVGGGSLPGQSVPTKGVAITVEKPDDLAYRLRMGVDGVRVIGRIQNNTLLLDPRTVLPHQEELLLACVEQCMA